MRLLIITQKVDEHDDVLGFMHGWVGEFAQQVARVSVVCLEKGRVHLPENVNVFSLGKEQEKNHESRLRRDASDGQARITNHEVIRKIKYAWRFVRYVVRRWREYDAVFVHMNPEYIVLAGWFWKLTGKMVALWYAHKSVTWQVRAAHLFTDIVFTSTASGFRLPSRKVKVVGQGIDVDRFNPSADGQKSKVKSGEGMFRILSVGRITPSKDYGTLIEAVLLLREQFATPFRVSIVGPVSSIADKDYLTTLKAKLAEKNLESMVEFLPPVGNKDLPQILNVADLFVNMGQTGSLDKAVPEAMACGVPILTCNEAFEDVLGPYVRDLMYPKEDAGALAEKIIVLMRMPPEKRVALGAALREIVVRDHSLASFTSKIIGEIQKHVRG